MIYANAAFAALLERVAATISPRRRKQPGGGPFADSPLWQAVCKGHLNDGPLATEINVQNRDGLQIKLRFRSIPIGDGPAGAQQRVTVFRDVTKEALLEDSFRRNERLAGIGLLGAGIAHEISNPAGSALLAAETALELIGPDHDDGIGGQLAACLRNIVTSMDRCGRIVRSLLRYSRQEPTEKQACNINDVVTQVIHEARPHGKSHGTELRTDLDVEVPLVPMNPLEIELVLLNLVRNAIEASDDKATVCIRTLRIDSGVRVAVSDKGRGMNEEQLAHVFDPLYTTRRNCGGSGVGLSIAKGIVQGHEGRMEVQSRLGKGTTVTVDLPITSGAFSDS